MVQVFKKKQKGKEKKKMGKIVFPGSVQIFGSDRMAHCFYQVSVSGWYSLTQSINQSINQSSSTQSIQLLTHLIKTFTRPPT